MGIEQQIPSDQREQEEFSEAYVVRTLEVYTPAQIIEAAQNGRLQALIYDANWDRDLDLPPHGMDTKAVAQAVLGLVKQ